VTIPAGFADVQIGGGAFTVGALTSSSPIEILGTGSLQLFGPAVETGTLTIDSGGTLDIQNNTLTINFASSASDPLATIQGYLKSGYDGDTWMGTGIISSTAQTDPGLYSIGYADGNIDTGTPAGANQILIENTIAGDANLDGTVNFGDLLVVAQNFNRSVDANGNALDWAHGDFNYDGVVNFADLLLVAQNFNKTFAAEQAAQTPSSAGVAGEGGGVTETAVSALSLTAPVLGSPMSPFPITVLVTMPIQAAAIQPATTQSAPAPVTATAATPPPATLATMTPALPAPTPVTAISAIPPVATVAPAQAENIPSPCTQGEGGGDGSSDVANVESKSKRDPHPNSPDSRPGCGSTNLPGAVERGAVASAPARIQPAIAPQVSPPNTSSEPAIMEDVLVDVWSGISPPGDGPLFSDALLPSGEESFRRLS
jgi:hypothetical protein